MNITTIANNITFLYLLAFIAGLLVYIAFFKKSSSKK